MKKYLGHDARIDHVAIAVTDLQEALFLYRDILGFELLNQREIKGEFSGMISAELCAGGFSIVLVQGTEPKSQVSRFIEKYGPGVQHVAIATEDIENVTDKLKASGMEFSTDIIRGENLIQIFTKRDGNSGVMFELIKRTKSTEGFDANNIQSLFEQLEANDAY
ncbi:VOC family protein [Thalassomonas viridans]|uniref:VOC family protein n=1 Tax=Thalassomonas viridans TaxID=137584 RepID=A0AAE9ZF23_9GAMM|nr:VOC family protein [Thalassomonas viridans]WDE09218.1 VOC family protein [Thalassomonas viridans]